MEKISKEQAIKEIQDLVLEHNFETKDTASIEKEYPQLIKAISEGNLVLSENPTFKLYKPLKDDTDKEILSDITFKTRIKPLAMASITKGIDMSKETYLAVIAMNCHLINQPRGIYDNLSKIDEKIVSQLCSIFL